LQPKEPRTINAAEGYPGVTLLRRLVMHKDRRTPSFRQLIVHTTMGAVLGALLALALIVTSRHLFELIAHSPSPTSFLALIMGVFSFLIAAGATLSGLIFTTMENELAAKRMPVRPPDKRRDLGE
jgi:NhaP-type Na+/H+ or K+/H+ antiporter